MLDSKTITMKQNVRFRERICPENIQPDQIQNVRISAFIDAKMHNIWHTVLVN